MEKTLEAIKLTGTQVSETTLINLWKSLDEGTSKWDKQTLLALDWGRLTDQTWK
jgi:hypothetical protein